MVVASARFSEVTSVAIIQLSVVFGLRRICAYRIELLKGSIVGVKEARWREVKALHFTGGVHSRPSDITCSSAKEKTTWLYIVYCCSRTLEVECFSRKDRGYGLSCHYTNPKSVSASPNRLWGWLLIQFRWGADRTQKIVTLFAIQELVDLLIQE